MLSTIPPEWIVYCDDRSAMQYDPEERNPVETVIDNNGGVIGGGIVDYGD